MRRFIVQVIFFLLLCAAPAFANTLYPCDAYNSSYSSYWYASMGGGANSRNSAVLGNGDKSFLAGPIMDVALGYQFNHHFRTEADFAFRTQPLGTITDSLVGDPLTAEESSFSVLLNGIFMADPICRFTPYAGWGIGYGDVLFSIHTNEIPPPSMSHTKHHSKGLGYQFIAGIDYCINSHLDLALEYRFHGITNLEYFFRDSRFQTNDALIKLIYAFKDRNRLFPCFSTYSIDPTNTWYITTKAGANFREKSNYANGTKTFHVGPVFAAAVGFYPFCDWGRTEFEFGFRQNEVKEILVSGFRSSGDEIILTAMLNGYISPINFCGLSPYVGGGLGYAYSNYAIHINLPPNPPPPSQPILPTFKHPRQVSNQFAYQFMGGGNYQISCHMQLGAEYQYFRINDRLYESFGTKIHENVAFHSATLRLTYLFK